jgi:hypothetical protein
MSGIWFISFMVLTVFCIDFRSSLMFSQFAFLYNGISRGFLIRFNRILSVIKRLIRKRDRWYKRSRKSGHSGDNKKFKDLKCTTQKEIRRAYWKYIDGIMSSETESELETGKRGNTKHSETGY